MDGRTAVHLGQYPLARSELAPGSAKVTGQLTFTCRLDDPRGHFVSIGDRQAVIPVQVVRATNLPMYRSLSVARPGESLVPLLRRLRPDIVHLASPVLLGWQALQAAVALDVPTVAVFQTDLSGFLRRYRLGPAVPAMWSWLRRLHNTADLTLVPSTTVSYQLRRHGIGPLALWSRGVDVELFRRPARRDESLRRELLSAVPSGLLVGFVGRLALEKRVDLLEPTSRLPGVQLVLIGDGPRAA